MREFYVYGFKSREGYDKKSARSYDDARRRVESWLGEYMRFRRTPEGKSVFLSIDTREIRHDPLFKAWKAKSFTDGDITLHFILFDLLYSPEVRLSAAEITARVSREYLCRFENAVEFDESTVRKKLKEYWEEGLLTREKEGRTVYYRRAPEVSLEGAADPISLFSEIAPCGVIGSFLLDKLSAGESCFTFKHHYIGGTLDAEILLSLFDAMHEQRSVTLTTAVGRGAREMRAQVLPLRVFISVQSGRQYLMAYAPQYGSFRSFRLDKILSVTPGAPDPAFPALRRELNAMVPRMWGVSTAKHGRLRPEQVMFTVRYEDGESYILQRLMREKRCGRVERIDAHTARFSAEVYDAAEMLPWIRTFIGRITQLHFSDPTMEAQFRRDLEEMYRMYGTEDGV